MRPTPVRTTGRKTSAGRDVLRHNASVMVNIDDGSGACIYDFKARFADGDELERYRINVCQISEYRYTAG